jgi:hypothetical protein
MRYLQEVKEVTRGAEVDIHCQSPDKIAGPAAFVHVKLQGNVERIITPVDRAQLERECTR